MAELNPSKVVKDAMYDLLNGNITLNDINLPIYQRVPESKTLPYIWIATYDYSENGSADCHIYLYNQEVIVYAENTTDLSNIVSQIYGYLRTGIKMTLAEGNQITNEITQVNEDQEIEDKKFCQLTINYQMNIQTS